MALTDLLTQIADSIRSKDGTAEPIVALDFPQRILDIPSGGSGLPSNVNSGTITLSGNAQSIVIEHNLGRVPVGVILFDENNYLIGNKVTYSMILAQKAYGAPYAVYNDYQGNKAASMQYECISDVNELSFTAVNRTGTYYYRSGVTYRWFAWRESNDIL